MIRYAVVLSPRAQRHVAAIHAWWLKRRPVAPTLFVDELAALEAELADGTLRSSGVKFEGAARIALPACPHWSFVQFGN